LKFRIKLNEFGFLLLFLGCFWINVYVREIFVSDQIAAINFLAIIGTGYLVYLGIKNRLVHIKLKSICFLGMAVLTVLFVLAQLLHSNKSFIGSARYFFNIIFPIVILYLSVDAKYFDDIFKMFIKFIDILVAVMLIMLIVDLLTGNAAIKSFAKLAGDSSLITYAHSSTRHASIVGHYISTAEVYLIFYMMHAINMSRKKTRGYENVVCMLISLVGIACSGSKSGIVMMVLMLLIFNVRKIKYMLTGALIVAVVYFSGALDLVLSRLSSGDLTTGRVEKLVYLNRYYNLTPIIGNGANSSFSFNKIVSWSSAAFEFPAVMFSYEYGIIFAVVFYLVVFLVPIIMLIRKKNYTNLAFLLMLDVFVNGYNGIGVANDYFFIYVIAVFFILNSDKIINAAAAKKAKKTIIEYGEYGGI
jgi:hypothetical protein